MYMALARLELFYRTFQSINHGGSFVCKRDFFIRVIGEIIKQGGAFCRDPLAPVSLFCRISLLYPQELE